jgi:hypothetical protein
LGPTSLAPVEATKRGRHVAQAKTFDLPLLPPLLPATKYAYRCGDRPPASCWVATTRRGSRGKDKEEEEEKTTFRGGAGGREPCRRAVKLAT